MDTTDKQKKKPPQKPKAVNTAWVGLITVISFALSVVMSYISNEALASAGTILSFAVLLLFIALGIVFDMIGVASTSATEKEFHSMAAHRVRGAREAVWMVRNAEKVSSICNDVVGDICGVVSGSASARIFISEKPVMRIVTKPPPRPSDSYSKVLAPFVAGSEYSG